jgi:hypothetical protein
LEYKSEKKVDDDDDKNCSASIATFRFRTREMVGLGREGRVEAEGEMNQVDQSLCELLIGCCRLSREESFGTRKVSLTR